MRVSPRFLLPSDAVLCPLRARRFPLVTRESGTCLLLSGILAAMGCPALSDEAPIVIGAMQPGVNVMKNAMPRLPIFPKLVPKKGFLRGYVKDTNGKPLAGAKIGVRSTLVGGFYSGASTQSDAKGYYELAVPRGAASYYCAGYAINYGAGRAAVGLHPADGDAGSFASVNGAVENWVLLPYGIADRDGVSENPYNSGNYYGGTLFIDFQVADPRPLFANDDYLPEGAEIELVFTPTGKLIDGSQGRAFTLRKKVEESGLPNIRVNNLPISTYRVTARLLQSGRSAPLRLQETGPYISPSFGLEPKEARGQATLTFRPNGAKPESALAQHGNWDSVAITLKK